MAYKDFQAAQVLTAQEVDTYLMNQSVIVFDDATQRSSTLTAPTEGMVTYLKDIDQVQFYNGTDWVALVSANARNLLYNGEMLITQRATTVTGVTSTRYTNADRWKTNMLSAGTFTYTMVNDVPPNSGFRRAVEIDCTTANTSLGSGAYHQYTQELEGQDVQQLNYGYATAQYATASFWVKTNKTGTYNVELRNEALAGYCSKQFVVSVADTWQKVVLIYPPSTSGQIVNSNTAGVKFQIWLSAGSNFSSGTHTGTWGTANNGRAVGNVNLADSTSNYFRITGVQLNVGFPAQFEFKSVAQYLTECERYYQVHSQPAMRGVVASGGFTRMGYPLTTTMRTNASVSSNGGTMGFWNGSTAAVGNVVFSLTFNFSPSSVEADISSSGFGASGQAAIFYKASGHTFVILCDAEL